jgi:hypothetical protein
MEESLNDRMAQPGRRRGPQPGQSVTPLPMIQPAEVVEIPQPSLTGIRCPGCGRSMVPRRDRTEGTAKCYARCTLCPARMVLTFADGLPATVRLIP